MSRPFTLRRSPVTLGALVAMLVAAGSGVGCSQSTTKAAPNADSGKAPRLANAHDAGMVAASTTFTLPPDPFVINDASSHWRSGQGTSAEFPSTYAGVIGAGESSQGPAPILPGSISNSKAPSMPTAHSPSEHDGAENLRQVSFAHEGADFDPVLSRDGQTLFFASTAHSATSDIYSKSIDGKALTQLTTDPANDAMPAISPDGQRIAFASNRGGNWDIYVMSSQGGQAVQITTDSAQELHATWSPDGSMLAYCRLSETSGRWEIWVTEVDKPAVRRFLTNGLFPDWHPSANRILFQRSRERGDRYFSIWTIDYMNGDAHSPTMIASSASSAIINPRWSSDGEYIACATVPNSSQNSPAGRPAQSDIWIMKPSGSGRANLTGGRNLNLMPAWGQNNSVFFVSDRSGSDNIWATNSQQAILAASSGPPSMTPMVQSPHYGRPDSSRSAPMANIPKPSLPSWQGSRTGNSAPQAAEPDVPPEIANVPTDMSDGNH